MLQAAHILLMTLYVVLPPAMLLSILFMPKPSPDRPSRVMPNATVAIASSLLLGVSASVIYDLWLGGLISPWQMLLTCYWAAGLVCILKLLDLFFDRATRLTFKLFSFWTPAERQGAAQISRVLLLFAIGLPYMIVAAATYRPRVIERNTEPWTDLGADSISFNSTDGLHLAGYWTTALPTTGFPNPRLGRQTLILCPGSRGGRTAYYNIANQFAQHGYNILTFDFRGHGESDGQIDSFGDRERRDVLGAVRWVQANHPMAARRIVGLGIDTGGAALLAAADDPSPEGQAIDAIAVFGCYDRFDKMVAGASFPPFLQWLIGPIGVPLACVQTGANLCDFSPARAAADIAPRPILFIHSERDTVISFERGQNLFDAAGTPKSHLWLESQTDEQAVEDPAVIARARHFLDIAIPVL